MKVVIPAAGLGLRFLPATKSQPKEMLPILKKPVIQYVVEEAVASGADDILIVTGRGKRSLEDHFDTWTGLVDSVTQKAIDSVDRIALAARIYFVRQRLPAGLGDAIACGRRHTGSEPFGVLLGDTINVCSPPLLSQLWTLHERLRGPVIAVEPVPEAKTRDYGIVEGEPVSPGVVRCTRLLEKPRAGETSSRLGITGTYVLTPEIYSAIDRTVPGKNQEIQLTDALQLMAEETPVFATTFVGQRFDIGDPLLWLKANLRFALHDPTYRTGVVEVLREIFADGQLS